MGSFPADVAVKGVVVNPVPYPREQNTARLAEPSVFTRNRCQLGAGLLLGGKDGLQASYSRPLSSRTLFGTCHPRHLLPERRRWTGRASSESRRSMG